MAWTYQNKTEIFATRNKNYKIGLILNIIICVDCVAEILLKQISEILATKIIITDLFYFLGSRVGILSAQIIILFFPKFNFWDYLVDKK